MSTLPEVPLAPETSTSQSAVKSHLSLNVANLSASVDFYRALFGREPAKRHIDYAKFELETPPVTFSLQPGPRPAGASLSHIGLRFTSEEAVFKVQERLQAAGIPFSRQEGVVCGYARQSKCWVADPDNNYWEIYVLEADVDPSRVRACLTQLVPADDGELPVPGDLSDEPVDTGAADCHVLYRGPFREVRDRAGRTYRRGQRMPLTRRTFDELRQGPMADQFLFAVQDAIGTCGGDNQQSLCAKPE
ncbi:MAG TPA: ArsI/CadI family heavy metal resistance metalloenzyme [Pirellulales bacterium]|nr:ArsI/CadI family heavy metal resistance metalloenzyme [Pirellulales bacterium]